MAVQVTPFNPVSLTDLALNQRNFGAQQQQRGVANEQNNQRLAQGEQRIKLTEAQIDAAARQAGIKEDRFRADLISDIASQTRSPQEAIQYSQAVGLPIPPQVFENMPPDIFGRVANSAGANAFNQITEGFSPEDRLKAQRVDAGLDPRAVTSAPKITMIGNVPHVFDPSSQTMKRVNVDGKEITPEIVGNNAGTVAGGAQTGKNIANRLGDAVLEGQIAADATATLRRSIQLIDSGVNTDRLSASQLAFTQSLGIEDPKAGELSNLLGKAVLSQLRATFGAAFTAEEGKGLAAIEASFGRNPATNKRLLSNALGLVNRAAERGIRAAEQSGDITGADEIRRTLEFTLGDDGQQVGGLSETSNEPLTPQEQAELDQLRQAQGNLQ